MKSDTITVETLQRELAEIDSAIREREEILGQIHGLCAAYSTRSDTGWLLSMLAAEAGTLLAVFAGLKARKWTDIAHTLEQEVQELKIDKRWKKLELDMAEHSDK